MNKAQLYKIVENLREQFRITANDYPLNVFDFCSKTSNVIIKAVPFKTQDLRGMVSLARNNNENNVIIVNSNKSIEEQNFHGFHELMHIPTAEERGTILRCYEILKPNQNSYIEWLANEGSAEFTVPYRMLLPIIKLEYPSLIKGVGTTIFCNNYASSFAVSPVVMQNRVDSLKYEIEQYMRGVPLDRIEILSNRKQVDQGIAVKSLVDLERERLRTMWTFSRSSKKRHEITI